MPGTRKNRKGVDAKPLNEEEALELARSSGLAHGWIKQGEAKPPLRLAPALEGFGLTPEEAGAAAAWRGMPTPAGVPEEFRAVRDVVGLWPEHEDIATNSVAFWTWADPGHYRGGLWTMRRAFEHVTPTTLAGRGAQKMAQWAVARAREHRPTPQEMAAVINAREDEERDRGKTKLIAPTIMPVRLYQVWSLEVNIRRTLGEEGSLDPETLAATLGPLAQVDCWRTSEAPTGGVLTRCTLCGLVTRDAYGFCWGSFRRHSYTTCPACQGEPLNALMKDWEAEPEAPRPSAEGPRIAAAPPPSTVPPSRRLVPTKAKEAKPQQETVVQKSLFDL